MAGRHAARQSFTSSGKARHRARRGRVEPYRWLGAGAVAIGLGVAVANGSPLAHADDTTAGPSASTHDTSSPDGNTGDSTNGPGGDSAGSEAHEPGGPADGGQSADDDHGGLGSSGSGDDESGEDDDDNDSLTDDLDEVTTTPGGVTSSGGGHASGSPDDESVASDDDEVAVDESEPAVADDVEVSQTIVDKQVSTPVEEQPSADEPAQDTVVIDAPPVPSAPGTVVAGALAPNGADTAVPSPPPAPVAPPTVDEVLLAAYRPANQRTQVNVQTTSLTTAASTPPLTLAAAVSSILARIALGENTAPYVVVTSPDGKRTYVITSPLTFGGANLPTSTVVGIDTATNQPIGNPLSVGYVLPSGFSSTAKAAAFNRDGSRLYVTSLRQGTGGQLETTVTVIDAANGQVVGSPIVTGSSMSTGLVVSPDGRRLYTANSDSTVTVVDLQNNTVVDTVPIGVFAGPGSGGGVLDIVISQDDAQTVYISDYAERAVYVLDPATDDLDPDPVLVNGFPVSLTLSPDGKRLFVNTMTYIDPSTGPANQASLVVVDTATKTIVGAPIDFGAVSRTPSTTGVTLVSPDGRYVYTQSFLPAEGGTPVASVWKIDTLTGTTQLLADGLYPAAPVLSPDGKRLYVPAVAVVDDVPQLAIGALDTTDGSMITRIPIDVGVPGVMSISPDGSRLYLGQLIPSPGGQSEAPATQLAVIDTGTKIVVTPPRTVNPITLIVRNITKTITASVQAIVHAINNNVAILNRLIYSTVTNVARTANTISVGVLNTGLAIANAAQVIFDVGGETLGRILTASEIALAAMTGHAGDIPYIVVGALGDLWSTVKNRSPVGFLAGQAISIWSYVLQEARGINPSEIPSTLAYAIGHPGVVLEELAKATAEVGLKVGTSMLGAITGAGKATTQLVNEVTRIGGGAGQALVRTVTNGVRDLGHAVQTSRQAVGQATTTIVNTVVSAGNQVLKGARDVVATVSKWKPPWPFS